MDKLDRWQVVSRLYNSALEREGDERGAFLNEACAGDDALRREVESLLTLDLDAAQFLATPALDAEARAIARSNRVSLIGSQLGPYRLLASLGSGGMDI